jgi:hypothetical protein
MADRRATSGNRTDSERNRHRCYTLTYKRCLKSTDRASAKETNVLSSTLRGARAAVVAFAGQYHCLSSLMYLPAGAFGGGWLSHSRICALKKSKDPFSARSTFGSPPVRATSFVAQAFLHDPRILPMLLHLDVAADTRYARKGPVYLRCSQTQH